jgi:protein-L-isoaspartate O-methyltransferase
LEVSDAENKLESAGMSRLREIQAYTMGVERAGATAETARRRMATTDAYIVTARTEDSVDGLEGLAGG